MSPEHLGSSKGNTPYRCNTYVAPPLPPARWKSRLAAARLRSRRWLRTTIPKDPVDVIGMLLTIMIVAEIVILVLSFAVSVYHIERCRDRPVDHLQCFSGGSFAMTCRCLP